MDKKSSIEWSRLLNIKGLQSADIEPDVIDESCICFILDPDGWDRQSDYEKSIREEITLDEFEKRLMMATCRFKSDLWDKAFEKLRND